MKNPAFVFSLLAGIRSQRFAIVFKTKINGRNKNDCMIFHYFNNNLKAGGLFSLGIDFGSIFFLMTGQEMLNVFEIGGECGIASNLFSGIRTILLVCMNFRSLILLSKINTLKTLLRT